MDAASHSMSTALEDYARLISVKWLVPILLLISMTLQLVLVVLGARRYKTSGAIFRFVVWGAYISADAVAVSALATMMHHSDRSAIYGIWAPVLLLHLGGPDAITAYSTADNELWLGHGFNMVYQVSVAVFVIYSSALEGRALASAILLLVAGATKYGERTLALWFANDSQIVGSCLPISTYIKAKNVVIDRGYIVMGEKQLLEPSSSGNKDIESRSVGPDRLERRGIVTIEDVKSAGVGGRDYINPCLSHALFKMYMRRFVSLYFNEGDWKETRVFWCGLNRNEAFRIVERELKFMYDVLYSKGSGTAFSSFGMVLRLLNIVLMGAAGFLSLRERQEMEAQRAVTYVVISVALLVEMFQLCRLLTSDWTWVRLICVHVEENKHRHSQSPLKCWSIYKLREIALVLLGKVRNLVAGGSYWSNCIHQYCVIGACRKRSRFLWKMTKFAPKADMYNASWYIDKVPVQEELKEFIFNILKKKCSPLDDIETCRDGIYYFEEDLFHMNEPIRDLMPSHDQNLEEAIRVWHIATIICVGNRKSGGRIENVNARPRLSVILSRYCVYLLLSHPRLLPVHPDMARVAYMKLVEQLMEKEYYGKDPIELLGCSDQSTLGFGAQLARELLGKEELERWELMAEYWGTLLIYLAVYSKARLHAECLGGGGEFLSQVWVVLGHMGCGEQSDSAVRKKIDSSIEGDRRKRRRMERDRLKRERAEWDRQEWDRVRDRLKRERREQDLLQELYRLEQERLEQEWRIQKWDQERDRQERELERLEQELKRLEHDRGHWEREGRVKHKKRAEGERDHIEEEGEHVEVDYKRVERPLDEAKEDFEHVEEEWPERLEEKLEHIKGELEHVKEEFERAKSELERVNGELEHVEGEIIEEPARL